MNIQEFDNLAKSGKVKATIGVSFFKIPRYVDKVCGLSSGFIRFRFKGDKFDTMCGLGGVRFMIEENETDRP